MFLFTLTVHAVPPATESAAALLEAGQHHLDEGDLDKALESLERALPTARDPRVRARIHGLTAWIFHELDQEDRCEEALRRMFELDQDVDIDAKYSSAGFRMRVDKVRAEYWFSMRTAHDERQEAEQQVIASMAKKQKRKKKVWPLLLVAAGVVTVFVAAFLLGSQEAGVLTGTLRISNQSSFNIRIEIDRAIRTIAPGDWLQLVLEQGRHTLIVSATGQTPVTYTVTVVADATTSFTFTGFD